MKWDRQWQWNPAVRLQWGQLQEATGPGKVRGWAGAAGSSSLPPSAGSTRGQQSAAEIGDLLWRARQLPASTPSSSHHAAGRGLLSEGFNSKENCISGFLNFPLHRALGLWMWSKCVCNNRELSGKPKEEFPESFRASCQIEGIGSQKLQRAERRHA